MRKKINAGTPGSAAPKSLNSVQSSTSSLRSQRQRRRRPQTTVEASYSPASFVMWFLLFLMALLVGADLLYFLQLSSSTPTGNNLRSRQAGGWNATGTAHPAAHEILPPLVDHPDVQQVGKRAKHEDLEPIFKILRQAKIDVDALDDASIDELPTWSQVVNLFGAEPVILGLENCQRFRESTDPTIRFYGIAGAFNTGTNLLSELMIKNCQITERMMVYGNQSKGMRWQVPWGKHYPASRRGAHITSTDHVVPFNQSLPLVTIRDPYQWAQSMCRHHYEAHWARYGDHCPNIVPSPADIALAPRFLHRRYFNVSVMYSEDFYGHYDSLMHLYNEYYQLYWNVSYPRIVVRFEDLLFHGQAVTETLCACGGGVPRDDRPGFEHIFESAKLGTAAHGSHKTNLMSAMIKYGNLDHRLDHMTQDDIRATKEIVDPIVMESFRYSHPDSIV